MPTLLEIFGLMVRRTIGFSDYWSFGPMVRRNTEMSPQNILGKNTDNDFAY